MNASNFFLVLVVTVHLGLTGCDQMAPAKLKEPYETFQEGEDRPGGEASVSVSGFNSFAQPSANMPVAKRMEFHVGNSFSGNPGSLLPEPINPGMGWDLYLIQIPVKNAIFAMAAGRHPVTGSLTKYPCWCV